MNVLYLKYAIEVAKTGSINKAAENLYMAQPNLSRSIKDLEASLGITIFERTSKGMIPTSEGEILLQHARELLRYVDEIEHMFRDEPISRQSFSLVAPRSSYVSEAFSDFSKSLDSQKRMELIYKETNALEVCNGVLHTEYKLGIVRYSEKYESLFQSFFEEKGLRYETVAEFGQVLILSKEHPLAQKEKVLQEDLSAYTEILYADPSVPNMPSIDVFREEHGEGAEQLVLLYDRGVCLELLSSNPNTFFRGERLPTALLKRYGLVEKRLSDGAKRYKDVMIFRKDYSLSKLDKDFITLLCNSKRKTIKDDD